MNNRRAVACYGFLNVVSVSGLEFRFHAKGAKIIHAEAAKDFPYRHENNSSPAKGRCPKGGGV